MKADSKMMPGVDGTPTDEAAAAHAASPPRKISACLQRPAERAAISAPQQH